MVYSNLAGLLQPDTTLYFSDLACARPDIDSVADTMGEGVLDLAEWQLCGTYVKVGGQKRQCSSDIRPMRRLCRVAANGEEYRATIDYCDGRNWFTHDLHIMYCQRH